MIIKNLTRNTTITANLKIASSPWDRFFGLLDNRNPKSLLFRTRFGIHTFGIKNPIDVLVIDKNNEVKIINVIKPKRIFIYNPKYKKIIELPKGTIKKSKTQIGDKIAILKN